LNGALLNIAQYDDGNDDDDGRQWNFIVSVQNDGDIDQF
jgi:hypothetical protein